MNATMTKVKDAQPMGVYTPTAVDARKADADFRLVQVSPPYIRWKDGRGEIVNSRKLAKLQKEHTWAADF